jgi:broad specificity phosphatase PhoE
MKRIALAILLTTAVASLAQAAMPVTTVILVRHAEKAPAVGDAEPLLSDAGIARAQTLAHMLADAHVTAIYTTQYKRTQLTGAPLAAALHLEETILPDVKDVAADIRAKHAGQTLLVVGHSNTIPQLLAALGVQNPPAIGDAEYDNLFLCTLAGGTASVVRLRF